MSPGSVQAPLWHGHGFSTELMWAAGTVSDSRLTGHCLESSPFSYVATGLTSHKRDVATKWGQHLKRNVHFKFQSRTGGRGDLFLSSCLLLAEPLSFRNLGALAACRCPC